MTLHSNQARAAWAVAILLAMIAGYLDGYGLLFLGTYVSFMSGNTTSAGLSSGQGDFHAAFPSAVAIVFFVTGSFLGNVLSQSRLRRSHQIMFGLIASEIATVAVLQWSGLPSLYFEIALLGLAMGMTNPALSKIGAESVSLTFVTWHFEQSRRPSRFGCGAKTSEGTTRLRGLSLASRSDPSKHLVWVSGRRSSIRNRGFKLSHLGPLASLFGDACCSASLLHRRVRNRASHSWGR